MNNYDVMHTWLDSDHTASPIEYKEQSYGSTGELSVTGNTLFHASMPIAQITYVKGVQTHKALPDTALYSAEAKHWASEVRLQLAVREAIKDS